MTSTEFIISKTNSACSLVICPEYSPDAITVQATGNVLLTIGLLRVWQLHGSQLKVYYILILVQFIVVKLHCWRTSQFGQDSHAISTSQVVTPIIFSTWPSRDAYILVIEHCIKLASNKNYTIELRCCSTSGRFYNRVWSHVKRI